MSQFARVVLIAAVLMVLAVPAGHAAAQANPRYIVIDLGTFGGPNSYFSIPSPLINDQGTAVGAADTTTTDPFCFIHPPDCHTSPTFAWRNGVLTNLGALAAGYSSVPNWISPNGLIAGVSENGTVDPLTNLPDVRAVLWRDGRIQDLGTFGGRESEANAVNDRGQVVGAATTTTPDSFPAALNAFGFFDFLFTPVGATQNRAFLWQDGHMQDLGTLGGNDAQATQINQAGLVAGWSTTGVMPNQTTGIPTVEPFLWDHGKMQAVGTLGGTFAFAEAMNDRGDITGTSTLQGDHRYHPFLWTGSGKPIDLATPDQALGQAHWINQEGDVAGWAFANHNTTVHGFLWKNGAEIDLDGASSDACAFADMVNAQDQVVGGSCEGNAILWQDGATDDLNTLLSAPSSYHLIEAFAINDRGEIYTVGTLQSTGEKHDILLVPSGLAASEGLRSNVPVSPSVSSATVRSTSPVQNERLPSVSVARSRRDHLRVR